MPKRVFKTFSLLIALSASVAVSQVEKMTMTLGGGQDGSSPILVTADNASFGDPITESRFWGNVVVVQGDVELLAEDVTVHTNPDRPLEVAMVVLSGGVRMETGEGTASAGTGVYDVEAKLITLTGQVVIEIYENEARITGERLTYDLVTGDTLVVGGR